MAKACIKRLHALEDDSLVSAIASQPTDVAKQICLSAMIWTSQMRFKIWKKLTGVGEVFPFMRIHTLLEALQPYFSDVPILVMYPGEFDGRHVKLFDRLTPNDYYRAFNVIDQGR